LVDRLWWNTILLPLFPMKMVLLNAQSSLWLRRLTNTCRINWHHQLFQISIVLTSMLNSQQTLGVNEESMQACAHQSSDPMSLIDTFWRYRGAVGTPLSFLLLGMDTYGATFCN
jgi:hypothetical protein